MMKRAPLSLNSSAPDRDEHVHLLIVGPGALALSKAVCRVGPEVDKDRRVVTVADALPIKGNESAPAVDLIVFTLAMNQRLSLDALNSNLAALGAECDHYSRGKWALAVLGAEAHGSFAFPLEHVEALAKQHLLPTLFCASSAQADLDRLAERVCAILRQASRVDGVSPLFALPGL